MSRPLILETWKEDKVIWSSSRLWFPGLLARAATFSRTRHPKKLSASIQYKAPGWKNGGEPACSPVSPLLVYSLDYYGYAFLKMFFLISIV